MTYTPSKIVQAVDMVELTRRCPMCLGTGYDMSTGSQAGAPWNGRNRGPWIPECQLCRGVKTVNLSRICCCGWAAVLWQTEEKFWYCGRLACLNHLKHKIIPAYGFGC